MPEEEYVKRKGKGKGKAYAVFRAANNRLDHEKPMSWYVLDVAVCRDLDVGAGDNGKNPNPSDNGTTIHPFSKVDQSKLSTIVSVGSKLYCIGGCKSFNCYKYYEPECNQVYSFDTSCFDDVFDGTSLCIDESQIKGQDWVRCRDMLKGRINPQAAVASGKIFVAGFFKMVDDLEDVDAWAEFYDPSTNFWAPLVAKLEGKSIYQLLNPEREKRFSFAMNAVVGSPMVIFSSSATLSSYCYNAATHTLRETNDLLALGRLHAKNPYSVLLGNFQYLLEMGTLNRFDISSKVYLLGVDPFARHSTAPGMGAILQMEQQLVEYAGDGGVDQLHLICLSKATLFKSSLIHYRCLDLYEAKMFNEEVGEDGRFPNLHARFRCTTPLCIPFGSTIRDGLILHT